MQVNVRLSGELARIAGAPRLVVEVEDGATVAAVCTAIERGHPSAAGSLDGALALVRGDHVPHDRPLAAGEELALLLPAAGGAH
jgi:molybdopterin converting factor small subunit